MVHLGETPAPPTTTLLPQAQVLNAILDNGFTQEGFHRAALPAVPLASLGGAWRCRKYIAALSLPLPLEQITPLMPMWVAHLSEQVSTDASTDAVIFYSVHWQHPVGDDATVVCLFDFWWHE
jgi:hypothetical protein